MMMHRFPRQLGATKARTLAIFAAILVVIAIVVVFLSINKKDALEQKTSTTTPIPSNITSVPGAQTSEKYKELQLKENKLVVEKAKQQGVSAIPTIIGNLQAPITPITASATNCQQGCCCNGAAVGGATATDEQAALDLATTDPAAFKRLMLENPALARRLALQNPELFKQLMRDDPAFAANFAANNPDALKALMPNDSSFVCAMSKTIPDAMKQHIASDASFAEKLAPTNGDTLRKFMQDPTFAKTLQQNDSALVSELNREGTPTLDPATAARLIGEIQKTPARSLELLQANPGLAKVLAEKDLSLLNKDQAHMKQFLMERPDLITKADQTILKKLLLSDPVLSNKLACNEPAAFKDLLKDPDFMNALAASNPSLMKALMREDADIAQKLAQINPDVFKQLVSSDPQLANTLLHQNPELMKNLMKNDLDFSKKMALNNPNVVKALLNNDPAFAADMAKRNPNSLKALLAGDPIFARNFADKNAETFKSLLKLDPDFAKLMILRNSDPLRTLFEQDPQFAQDFIANNPSIKIPGLSTTTLMANATLNRGTQQATVQKTRDDRLKLEQDKLMEEAYKKGLDELTSNMQTQLNGAMKIWTDVPSLSYTAGKWSEPKESEKVAVVGGKVVAGAAATPLSPILIKAGTIVFAVIDTAINSDEPGPIMATIVNNGPLKGAKVLGQLQTAGAKAEKLTLTFDTMTMEEYPTSFGIKAVAIDPDTSRTALASDVDHHYLLRYGTLLASSFMTGYSKVITSQGTTNTTATNGGTTTTTTPQLSGKKEILAALGDVGKAIGTAFADNVNRANTITIDSGTSVGLLFLGDVNEPQ